MLAGRSPYNPGMFGFLNVNKPVGPTSHDVIARLRWRLGKVVKIGHAGTLDPKASGVLVVCLGPATRLSDYVQGLPKRYLTTVALGAVSTTDDREGEITQTPAPVPPTDEALRAVLGRFVGEIQQVPPAHSAVHLPTGGRAYKAARAGRETNLAARAVVVHAIELVAYAWPLVTLDVACGSGTYIRSLARDIGEALGVGGYCSDITRTQVGPFALADALAPEALDPAVHLLAPQLAVPEYPRLVISEADRFEINHGRAIPSPASAPPRAEPFDVALEDSAGVLVALARCYPAAGRISPTKVFFSD
ncbi:MAG: tRNA pseudouridine(55) synthase TruB [Planctomycetota bacterium]|nr:tRNA pseudouridine(55) synthase TruB [Planctomycetota bacterium]